SFQCALLLFNGLGWSKARGRGDARWGAVWVRVRRRSLASPRWAALHMLHILYGLTLGVRAVARRGRVSGVSALCVRDDREGQPGNVEGYQDIGYFFLAIDPAAFGAPVDAGDYVRQLRETIRAMEPLDPSEPVQATGDRDFLTRAQRLDRGVPLADALVDQLRSLSTELGSGFALVEKA